MAGSIAQSLIRKCGTSLEARLKVTGVWVFAQYIYSLCRTRPVTASRASRERPGRPRAIWRSRSRCWRAAGDGGDHHRGAGEHEEPGGERMAGRAEALGAVPVAPAEAEP